MGDPRALAERIREATTAGKRLWIQGRGTRSQVPDKSDHLALDGFSGIVEYEPGELAVTARAGTPLAELEAALADAGQILAPEPPGSEGSLGGAVASGLSGPARPWLGDLRGAVLGVAMLNGRGELLRFGGRVMKNVAGYDLARLQCGAHGLLGPLLEVSLRTRPAPEARLCLARECSLEDALAEMTRLQREPWPLAGLAWTDGTLRIRLWGSEAGVAAARRTIGGDPDPKPSFWEDLREQRHPLQRHGWRLSLPPAAPQPALEGEWLIDWGGGLRWLMTDQPAEEVMEAALRLGGWALPPNDHSLRALAPATLGLHQRLKQAFDPEGVFNPGLLPEAG